MTLTLPYILSLPKIGSGSFRDVYSDGTYVYKVEYGEGITFSSNSCEAANYRLLRTMDLPVSIPETDLLVLDGIRVIRMPYVEGEAYGECFCLPREEHLGCLPDEIADTLSDLGIDLAYGNVILSDSTYWLVDFDSDLF